MSITRWFEADLSSGTATVTLTDSVQVTSFSLKAYTVRGLAGNWPSMMNIGICTRAGHTLGQSLHARADQNPDISMTVPISAASEARWFEQGGPKLTTKYAVNANKITINCYAGDGVTVLTGTEIRLCFIITMHDH